MPYRVRTVRDLDEFRVALGAIGHYFGWQPTDEDARWLGRIMPLERLYAAFDDDAIVGASGTTSVRLDPLTTRLTFASVPTGLQLAVNAATAVTPFTRTVIVGSANSVSAPSPQTLGGTTYAFQSWSDGGAQSHNITAPATAATYTANYSTTVSSPVNTGLPSISGQAREGQTLTTTTGTWTGSTPMTFAYQWMRCASASSSCDPIAGATGNAYVPVTADVGLRLRVTVIATNAGGSAAATSGATSPIKRARG